MAFNLSDVLKDQVSKMDTATGEIVNIDLDRIEEDSRNFYSIDQSELEALAGNIELVGQLDPVVVRKCTENPNSYILLSGHRRCRALRLLRNEGKEQFKTVKAIVRDTDSSPEFEELVLIFANSNTRKMSSADLNKQTERVTELLYKLQEQGVVFPGRMRDHVADACRISKSKLARLQAIRNNLSAEFYSCYVEGTLNESAAYALSRLPTEKQEGLARFKRVMNLAQKKDGLSGMRVEDAIRYAEKYQTGTRCQKDSTAMCTHCMERYAATICNAGFENCCGECCCECSRLNSCTYPCKHGKAQLAEAAAKQKTEKEAAEEEKQLEKNSQQAYRRLRQFAQVCRLADLCDRAGVLDDDDISNKSWMKVTAGRLRKLSLEGFAADANFYDDDFGILDTGLAGLEKLAEKLNCTVGELAGEEPKAVSKMDTNPWHRGDKPTKSGYYLGRWGKGKEVYYYDAVADAWKDYEDANYYVNDVVAWMEIPEDE